MGLRSSIDCPTSSTQSIFMAQSKGGRWVSEAQSTAHLYPYNAATLQLSQYLWPNQKRKKKKKRNQIVSPICLFHPLSEFCGCYEPARMIENQ
ncbi:unnamed protein product [Musa hybrid cultivar]